MGKKSGRREDKIVANCIGWKYAHTHTERKSSRLTVLEVRLTHSISYTALLQTPPHPAVWKYLNSYCLMGIFLFFKSFAGITIAKILLAVAYLLQGSNKEPGKLKRAARKEEPRAKSKGPQRPQLSFQVSFLSFKCHLQQGLQYSSVNKVTSLISDCAYHSSQHFTPTEDKGLVPEAVCNEPSWWKHRSPTTHIIF